MSQAWLTIDPAAMLLETEGMTGTELFIATPRSATPIQVPGTFEGLKTTDLPGLAATMGLPVADPTVALVYGLLRTAQPLLSTAP